MLSLTNTKATFANLNCRAEKHGEQNVPATDLNFSFDAANTLLDVFDASLRPGFWRKADASQGELVEDPGHVTALRFPKIKGRFKYDAEIKGCRLIVDYGIGGPSNIVLDTCVADSFSFEPKEGGTVNIAFRVRAKPSGEQVAKLYSLIQNSVQITLEPPAPGTLIESDDDAPEEE